MQCIIQYYSQENDIGAHRQDFKFFQLLQRKNSIESSEFDSQKMILSIPNGVTAPSTLDSLLSTARGESKRLINWCTAC